jgi:hypothetical protein
LKRQAVASIVMRRHTARFCAGLKACHCCTSSKLRPQPLHSASPCAVEQMAMHGASGVEAYQASQASCAAAGIVASSQSLSW